MKIKVFLILSVFISCSSTEKSVFGTYSSKKQNWKDNLFIGYDIWANGTTLNLEKDSSFVLKSCGNTLKGDWKIKNDSLLLYIHSNKFNIDSLNFNEDLKNNFSNPYYYLIQKKTLSKKTLIFNNEKKLILFQKLIKVKPEH